MVLTEEQKKERHRQAQKRYLENLKKKAKEGDEKALKRAEKVRHKQRFNAAKSFIHNYATKTDISALRDTMAERIKELNRKV